MIAKRFIVAWLISVLVMFGLSYAWHFVILNDAINIRYSLMVFLGMSVIVYLVIGFILTYLYQYMYVKEMKYKGFTIGSILGFFIYLVAFVFGVSFNSGGISYVVVDFVWQMIEQGIGGAVVGFFYSVFTEMENMKRFEGQNS